MPLSHVGEDLFSTGKNVFVRVGNNPSDAQMIAFVKDYSIEEDFETQEARGIGQFSAFSIDAVAYHCNVKLSGFIPRKDIYSKLRGTTAQMGYSLKKCLLDIVPKNREYIESGVITKIPYFDIIDNLKNPTIMKYVEGLTITHASFSGSAGAYSMFNLSMKGLTSETNNV